MPKSNPSRSRSRSRHTRRRPAVSLTAAKHHDRHRTRSPSPPRRMDRPRRPPSEPSSNSARARKPAADNSAALTTAQPTDTTTKKPLPAHVVRTREIPGNNYEYTVNVDGVDYKTVSAFYCTLCHAQLHATSIEMHISSKKHKAKLGADQDDMWEDESRP